MRPRFVWSSDLARARETAERSPRPPESTSCTTPRLREYDLGERTGITMAEYAEAHPEEYVAFRAGRYDVVPGGESTEQVVTRVAEAVHAALAALGPGEAGVVVGHGAALKVSLLAILGWPDDLAATLEALHNCCWAELRDSGVDGGLRLAAYNRRAVGTPDFASPWVLASIPRVVAHRSSGPQRWGCGAAGSAPAWHAGGQGFESPQLHATEPVRG